jgi:hypothetical protein
MNGIATAAGVATTAVSIVSRSASTFNGAATVEVVVAVNTASPAAAASALTAVNQAAAGGMLNTVTVTNISNVNTTPPAVPASTVAPSSAPQSSVGRVIVRVSVVVTGFDLTTFTSNTASFRQAVANALRIDVQWVTIISTDIVTVGRKFNTNDVGVRVVMDISAASQTDANNVVSTLQSSANGNNGKLGAFSVRNIQSAQSNSPSGASIMRSGLLWAAAAVLAALLF